MKALKSLSVILVYASVFSLPVKANDSLNIIKINAGLVSGSINEDETIHIFKGIPFAAPPTGNLRWQPPQPVKAWEGVKKCDAFSASPMQATPVPFSMWSAEFLIPQEPISEDCLYLNVWTGAKGEHDKLPVLVWIYGGGFTSGGSAVPIYDGEAMAKKGIVFVSINYRVGIFGFFAHPELTQESSNNTSGNYGLMDQIAALKWVQQNIAAFGGDPSNVTIAGQSAGSMSVNCLVASPLAKNLFIKAIAESGASMVSGALGGSASLQQAEEDGIKIMQHVNASSLTDLRDKPPSELLKQSQGIRGPIIDGYVLPNSVATVFSEGKQNDVTLLTGWNEDEGLSFGPIKKAEEFQKQSEEQYGENAKTFLQYYPASNDSVAATSQLNLSRDMIFGVQNYTWANVAAKLGKQKVYVYRFTRKLPATGEYVKYGAFHTGEVAYAYDNLKFIDRPWESVDHKLAEIMSSYWANFIKTGNPNTEELPEWPAYIVSNRIVMVLGENPHAASLPDHEALDFLYNQIRK